MPRSQDWQGGNPCIGDGLNLSDVTRAAELAARASYGKLLAILAAHSRDIALAEDALGDAFAKALALWPERGIPDNPDAWLLQVAKNGMSDRQRQLNRFPVVEAFPDMADETVPDKDFPDQRLALLMVCAHPAIAADLHTPLMLQTVLGIEAKVIARLFMVSPAALAKRLVRAKRKIRDAGIPFEIPDGNELPARSAPIFEAVYAIHTLDWLEPGDGMGDEALYLADLLIRLLTDQPEALGLAALIAFGHARRNARIANKCLVPVEKQNTDLWDKDMLAYANRQLHRAHRLDQPGRFQLEAAIQAVHMARQESGRVDWASLDKLYYALLKIAPSLGGLVAHSVVISHVHGVDAGLAALAKVESLPDRPFQPYWAARADFLARAGRADDAKAAYEKAISLTTEPPVIRFLQMRQAMI